jgi:hypothetical protein
MGVSQMDIFGLCNLISSLGFCFGSVKRWRDSAIARAPARKGRKKETRKSKENATQASVRESIVCPQYSAGCNPGLRSTTCFTLFMTIIGRRVQRKKKRARARRVERGATTETKKRRSSPSPLRYSNESRFAETKHDGPRPQRVYLWLMFECVV